MAHASTGIGLLEVVSMGRRVLCRLQVRVPTRQVPALTRHPHGRHRATRPRVSRFAVMLVLYNLLGFGALVVYQLNTTWYFSTSNLALGPDPGLNSTSAGGAASGDTTDIAAQPAMIDWSRIVTLVVHAPLAEELVFRAGMFYVALSRYRTRRVRAPLSLTSPNGMRTRAGARTLCGVQPYPVGCLRAYTCSTP